MKYLATIGEREISVEMLDDQHVVVNGQAYEIDFDSVENQPVSSLLVNGHSYEAFVYPAEGNWQVLLHGRLYPVIIEDEREKSLRTSDYGGIHHGHEFQLKAPMPGMVVAVLVQDGQKVAKGDVLLILESMKMQNELKSPRDGIVLHIRITAGSSVEQHQVILTVGDE